MGTVKCTACGFIIINLFFGGLKDLTNKYIYLASFPGPERRRKGLVTTEIVLICTRFEVLISFCTHTECNKISVTITVSCLSHKIPGKLSF